MNTIKSERLFSFVGGDSGSWRVVSSQVVVGEPLPLAKHVAVVAGSAAVPAASLWTLRGVTSNGRYTRQQEHEQLVSRQAPLGRPDARCAALIPIRKNAAWWALTQDKRRAIFEEQSRHIAIGLKYLPSIARRLHHCRDLGESEPFDFLTFFDFRKEDSAAFDGLLAALRASEEWRYVDREIDIRLERS